MADPGRKVAYDVEVAPALLRASEACARHGLSMVAAVEIARDGIERTARLHPGNGFPISLVDLAVRANGNVDALIIALVREARGRGHASTILDSLGVPARPGGGTASGATGPARLEWTRRGNVHEAALGTCLVGSVRDDGTGCGWRSEVHEATGREPRLAEAKVALEASVRAWLEGFRSFMDAEPPAGAPRPALPPSGGETRDGVSGILTCLPMADVHGSRYLAALGEARGGLVLDLRRFPYFDLDGLGRPASEAALARAGCRYRHFEIDLKESPGSGTPWEMQASRRERFREAVAGEPGPLVVLVDRERDVSALARCLRPLPGGEAGAWEVRNARGARR